MASLLVPPARIMSNPMTSALSDEPRRERAPAPRLPRLRSKGATAEEFSKTDSNERGAREQKCERAGVAASAEKFPSAALVAAPILSRTLGVRSSVVTLIGRHGGSVEKWRGPSHGAHVRTSG